MDDGYCIWCEVIAKARDDERAQAATRMYLQREHLRADLRAKVEALRDVAIFGSEREDTLGDVLALIAGG